MRIADLLDLAAAIPSLIGEEIKARDKREPDRLYKLKWERQIQAAVRRHWKRQLERMRPQIEMTMSAKTIKDILRELDEFDDEDFFRDLWKIFTDAAKRGAGYFRTQVNIGFDDTLVNVRAAEWARGYALDLIKDITSTTRAVISEVIAKFIETPGMTIGDIVRELPFGESRALSIAVTETTRAYAEGEMQAGRELAKQFPGVRIVKRWYTNNDDRVCEICGPMNEQEQDIDDPFEGGDGEDYDAPPAHVNCRCWTSSSTRITDD